MVDSTVRHLFLTRLLLVLLESEVQFTVILLLFSPFLFSYISNGVPAIIVVRRTTAERITTTHTYGQDPIGLFIALFTRCVITLQRYAGLHTPQDERNR